MKYYETSAPSGQSDSNDSANGATRLRSNRTPMQAINQNCKDCIYDPLAAGTWRQQVTLCSVGSCAFFALRPTTKRPIPECVLNYYRLPEGKRWNFRGNSQGTVKGPSADLSADPVSTHCRKVIGRSTAPKRHREQGQTANSGQRRNDIQNGGPQRDG
jgi:hypothetical protein